MYYLICVFSGITELRWYVPVIAISYKLNFRELLFICRMNCNLPPEQELSIIYFYT